MANIWKKVPLYLVALLTTSLVLWSCDEEVDPDDDEEEAIPDFSLVSEEGLDLMLTWEAGANDSASIANVDMDLALYRGNTLIEKAEEVDSFETITFDPSYANATYNVQVTYYKGDINANYTLDLVALEGTDAQAVTGTLTPSDVTRNIRLFSLQKTDSLYKVFLIE